MGVASLHRRLFPHSGTSTQEATLAREGRCWVETLSTGDGQLSDLIALIEQDFLAIGAQLLDFSERAQGLSNLAMETVQIMTGEEITQAISGLGEILLRLGNHLKSTEEESRHTSTVMEQYLGILRKVCSSLDGMKMLVMNLRMLGFYTKVEHAHIQGRDSGFNSLADDVTSLSQGIDAKTVRIASQSSTLPPIIHSVLSEVSSMGARSGSFAHTMMHQTQEEHEKLTRKYEQASGVAQRIGARTEKIAGNINTIVASLQFSDITRQQMEHVQEALAALREALPTQERLPAQLAARVCALQSAQLAQTKGELGAAILKVKQELTDIARGVEHTAQEITLLANTAESEEQAFMEEVNSGIKEVIVFLEENTAEHEKLTQTITEVCTMVTTMSSFVQDIETMGVSLQLIALNARIKAAHMGMEGAALDTISESIYGLSRASREDTHSLSETLKEMVDSADAFSSQLHAAREQQQGDTSELTHTMQRLIESLYAVDERVLQIIRRMNANAETLSHDIHRVVKGITVQEKVQAVLLDVTSRLKDIAERAEEICSEEGWKENDSLLKQLSQHYTMESERNVHRAHASAAGPPATAPQTPLADDIELWGGAETSPGQDGQASPERHLATEAPGEEDLGDNVELF